MNTQTYRSKLLNDFAVQWSLKKESGTPNLLYTIDNKAKEKENERDALKLDIMEYRTKFEALDQENEKLKAEIKRLEKRLERFENPN